MSAGFTVPLVTYAGFGGASVLTEYGALGARRALAYDATSRDWQVDDDGAWVAVHPVQQMIEIGCLFAKGEFSGAPECGHTLLECTATGSRLHDDVESRIRTAEPIATVLASGEAVIDSVDAERDSVGALRVAVHYRNLAAGTRGTVRI
jgi:hypothetical protein